MVKTTHQFLDKYPINNDSKKLILGTIHPHNVESFEIPFFYGNVSSLWKIFSEAFPAELNKPLTLRKILQFLTDREISVSDTIRSCYRKTPNSAADKDLEPIEFNKQLINAIRDSKITKIFFTSGFGKNNAFKLFYKDILKQKITIDIRNNREVILDEMFFGRPIKLIVLYSPSKAATRGIVKSKAYKKSGFNSVHNFLVDYYRKKFNDNKEIKL
ncbi:MAG: hypothetical protein LBV16_04145 [Elusimicrobiota bacterium]|jgi:G:T/U-mismatch repair DNA glycosylase|nr:hypothetical protein [Elusimicrobiota bacterium]